MLRYHGMPGTLITGKGTKTFCTQKQKQITSMHIPRPALLAVGVIIARFMPNLPLLFLLHRVRVHFLPEEMFTERALYLGT